MKRITLTLTVLLAALILSACSAVQPYRDLEGVQIEEPANARIVLNADEFPNVSILCVDGVALGTTTRENSPITVLPEGLCSR